MARPVASTAVTGPPPRALVRWWRIVTGVVRAAVSGTARPDLLRRYEAAIARRVLPSDPATGRLVSIGVPTATAVVLLLLAAAHVAVLFLIVGLAAIALARVRFPSQLRAGRDPIPLEVVAGVGMVLLVLAPLILLAGFAEAKALGLIGGGVYVAIVVGLGRRGILDRLGGRGPSYPVESDVQDEIAALTAGRRERAPLVRFVDDPVPNLLTFTDLSDASVLVVTTGFVQLPAGPARRALLERALAARWPGLSIAPGLMAMLVSPFVPRPGPGSGSRDGRRWIARIAAAVLGQQRVLAADAVTFAADDRAGTLALADGLLALATATERSSSIDPAFGHLCLVDPQPYDTRRGRDRAHPTLLRRITELRERAGAEPLGSGLHLALADEH